jgi:hypothetical protein
MKLPIQKENSYSDLVIGIYGKVNGGLRARRYYIKKSKNTKPSLRKFALETDYSLTFAETIFGTYGIRV